MLLRTDLERLEYERLSPRAAKAAETRGRAVPEEQCEFRTDFQRDRDRIIHSKAFRRLMHKTQVFLAHEGDHYRTRLTHTLEVAQVARTIARALAYNEDLTEAIALGHDIGHTPFGHSGESILNLLHPEGFRHNEQSLRVVDELEMTSRRRGLNLTMEVRDGIRNHSGPDGPFTLEGQIVRISDRIAYVNHDIDDALRSGVLSMSDIPKRDLDVLGMTHSERINNLIVDLVRSSDGQDSIRLSDTFSEALLDLRAFMFEHVYYSPEVKRIEDLSRIETVLTSLYRYYCENPQEMPTLYVDLIAQDGVQCAVKDYISCMTDRFAMSK